MLLARSLSGSRPGLRIARRMQHCQYDDALGFDAAKKRRTESATRRLGEPRHGPAQTSPDSARSRQRRNRPRSEISRQALLPFLRSTRIQQRDPALPSGGTQPAETSASSSIGEHLVSGNDVVGIALVFCQTLVDYSAVSVAQRHRSGVRGETCPDDFCQPKALFGRQRENFGDIGITHRYGVPPCLPAR